MISIENKEDGDKDNRLPNPTKNVRLFNYLLFFNHVSSFLINYLNMNHKRIIFLLLDNPYF